MTAQILYTDGREVTVTDSFIQVRQTLYQLNGITRHNFLIMPPDRLPAIFMLSVGAIMIILGSLHLVPKSLVHDVALFSVAVTANVMAIVLGLLLILAGSLMTVLLKNRYGVSVATAEGEKIVVISSRKEYVAQIVEALNRAFFNLVLPARERVTRAEKNKVLRELLLQKLSA